LFQQKMYKEKRKKKERKYWVYAVLKSNFIILLISVLFKYDFEAYIKDVIYI
jgi:hypothetical protein